MKGEIYNVDYSKYVSLVGTAHFTKRSLHDAYEAVERLQPSDLAIELDLSRFKVLNNACSTCLKSRACDSKCEFIGAAEALGNVDANIWLIDMSEREIRQRIRRLATPTWIFFVRIPFIHEGDEIVRRWERGFKDEVLNAYEERLANLRRHAPAVWRVLIDERDTLMAVRLAWIASEKLRENRQPSVLALVGAAHVEGIKDLLRNPVVIKENLRRLGLSFTPPTLIRRISVRGD